MKTIMQTCSLGLILAAGLTTAQAQGTAFHYQGRLDRNGSPAPDGFYDFQFGIHDAMVAGSPIGAVYTLMNNPVTNGVFTVRLDFGSGVFTGAPRWLSLAVRTNGVPTFTLLQPRTELTATTYAIFAGGVAASGITGSIPLTQLPSDVALLNTYQVFTADKCFGPGAQIQADFGTPLAPGYAFCGDLDSGLFHPAGNTLALATGGTERLRVSSGGNVGIGTTEPSAKLDVNGSLAARSSFLLLDETNALRARIVGTGLGVTQSLLNGNEVSVLVLDTSGDNAGLVSVRNSSGSTRVGIDGDDGSGGGRIDMRNTNNMTTVRLVGDETDGAGQLLINNGNGQNTVQLDGQLGAGAYLGLSDMNGRLGVSLAANPSTGGTMNFRDTNGTLTVQIIGAENTRNNEGGQIILKNGSGRTTVQIDGDDPGNGGWVGVYNKDGDLKIQLDANATGGARLTTQVLEITGGSDLSENFDVTPVGEELKAGLLVSIDPEHPGQLVVSSKAYDRTVAGVMSGAGGVRPGMLMGQQGSVANGRHPVALTGRVYCWVDADAGGAIAPGDLLTTSATPGHGMKVGDHAHAQAAGAIIGKAMTKLTAGKGLVLVLVNLQ
jgi:hypothetical protein